MTWAPPGGEKPESGGSKGRMADALEARERDFLSGVRSGVNGTPTFFINCVRHNGGYDLKSLVAALREAF